jgi:1-acyl-sn-glycerol-3-phosphate acyltransferase
LSAQRRAIDGFVPGDAGAIGPRDEALAERGYRWIERASRLLGVEVEGIEHLRSGPALLVANHAFGWDVVFVMGAIRERTGRRVWALGEHLWWRVPFLRRIASALGTVDGTPENLELLLARGELVLVLPGGLREAVKPRELRYRLLWGHRYGFVRAAIASRAPIVPLACVGADDLFDFVGNAYRRGERWLGRPGFPIPLPARVLPIPHRARLRYVFGEPIPPPESDDEVAQRRLRHEVEGALHELLEVELARRAGIALA